MCIRDRFSSIFIPYLTHFLPYFHVRSCYGRVKSVSFSALFTHITSFDIFRNFIEETERWITFSRNECQEGEKSCEKVLHGSPTEPDPCGTTNPLELAQVAGRSSGMTVPYALVGPCQVAHPCHLCCCRVGSVLAWSHCASGTTVTTPFRVAT